MNKIVNTKIQQCPCGAKNDYVQCCGQFISGEAVPQTPEQLMRSRYTAYTTANVDYIQSTMREDALESFDRKESLNWARNSKWIGLKIISASEINTSDVEGNVEFIASYIQNHQIQHLREHSKFKKEDGRWYFVGDYITNDSDTVYEPESFKQATGTKIGRNDACHCGSGKKFKKCCLA